MEKNVPVVFKGLAKRSPAYELFTDEFLKSFEGADTTMVSSETRKKEDRKQNGLNISFKEFIERYHNESLYLVDSLPKQLRLAFAIRLLRVHLDYVHSGFSWHKLDTNLYILCKKNQ